MVFATNDPDREKRKPIEQKQGRNVKKSGLGQSGHDHLARSAERDTVRGDQDQAGGAREEQRTMRYRWQ